MLFLLKTTKEHDFIIVK